MAETDNDAAPKVDAARAEDDLGASWTSPAKDALSEISLREARVVAVRRWVLFVSTMLLALPFYLLLLFVLGRAALGNLAVSSALLAVLTAVPPSLLIAARATAIDTLARRSQRLRKSNRSTLEELIMSLELVTGADEFHVLVGRLARPETEADKTTVNAYLHAKKQRIPCLARLSQR